MIRCSPAAMRFEAVSWASSTALVSPAIASSTLPLKSSTEAKRFWIISSPMRNCSCVLSYDSCTAFSSTSSRDAVRSTVVCWVVANASSFVVRSVNRACRFSTLDSSALVSSAAMAGVRWEDQQVLELSNSASLPCESTFFDAPILSQRQRMPMTCSIQVSLKCKEVVQRLGEK